MNRDKDFLVGWVFKNLPSTAQKEPNFIRSFIDGIPRHQQVQFTADKSEAQRFILSEARREAQRLQNPAVEVFIHTF